MKKSHYPSRINPPVAVGNYSSFRFIFGIGLIIMGIAAGLFGSVVFQGGLPVAQAACSGQNLYLGSYYLLPDDGSHPDFEQVLQRLTDVPGQLQPVLVNGLPVPVTPNPPLSGGQPTNTSIRQFDWYTPQYQTFTRLDNNPLAFSNDNVPNTTPYFGPGTQPAASAGLPANKDLFTVHWHANLFAPPGGLTIPYSFALDDAGWVFLDGQLQIDHGGIHPPATFTGNFVIPAGPHRVDVFYADRHTVDAVTNFQLGNLGALQACGSPNLNLIKSVQPSTIVNPGDLVTYTIQVSNSGNYTATNTIIRDTTPANTSFVSATPAPVSGPAVGGSGELVWNAGTLLPGQSRTLVFTVRVNPNTPPAIAIANSALGTSDESGGVVFRSNGVSNLVNATATLAVNKTAVPPAGSNVNIGDTVTYNITVNNFGNVATGSVVVQDPLPVGTSYVSATPAPQSVQNGMVRWVLPPLAPNSSATLTLSVKVINRPPGGLMQNQASASSNGLSAGSPLVTHNVNDAADLSMNKLIDGFDAPLAVGSLITYTLQGANAGPSAAAAVIVSDTLPAGTVLVSSTPPPTTQAGNNLTWNLGNLPPGTIVPITVTAQVVTLGGGNFTNRAGISSNTPDIQPGNNTSQADVPGGAAPVDATVIKTGPPVIAPNEVYLYTLKVSSVNGGDNIVVTDTLQAGLTLVPEQTTPPPLTTNPLTWVIGHLNPGQSTTIILAVKATGVTPGTNVGNTVQVAGGTGPGRPVSSTSNANSQVANGSNLSISKAAVSGTFAPGQPLTFNIAVKNNDPVNASGGVTVTDTLLPGFTLQSSNPAITSSQVNPDNSTTLTWRLAGVPANGTTTISLTVLVPSNYSGPSVANSASLQTDTPNTNPTISTDPVQVPRVGLLANLVVSKDSLSTSLKRGQAFAYTITVNNSGPIEAKDVVVQDPLPAGLTYISAQPAPTGVAPLTWNLGNLPANGGRATITLLVSLSQNFSGSAVSNSASVSSLTGNSNQPNSTVVKTIPINAPPASATPAITRQSGQTANTPTPTIAATAAVTTTTTPGATLTLAATATATTATETSATTASVATATATASSSTLPGVPNAGKDKADSGSLEWLAMAGSLTIGLLLVGFGVWLLLPHRPRRR